MTAKVEKMIDEPELGLIVDTSYQTINSLFLALLF